jgi:hypothetical protein
VVAGFQSHVKGGPLGLGWREFGQGVPFCVGPTEGLGMPGCENLTIFDHYGTHLGILPGGRRLFGLVNGDFHKVLVVDFHHPPTKKASQDFSWGAKLSPLTALRVKIKPG